MRSAVIFIAAVILVASLLLVSWIHSLNLRPTFQSQPSVPATATVITIGAAWLGSEANQQVSVPCPWILNNPYGDYLPPNGEVPVTASSWMYALNICDGQSPG